MKTFEGEHIERYVKAALTTARSYKREKKDLGKGSAEDKLGAVLFTSMMIATQAALDHPKEAAAALEEMGMPLGIREEVVRNAMVLAKGRTGTRPPGFNRKTKH